eukprot:TRINITY_DN22727_c0_g1_i1.p1 TRINITY_DN22727_c0_g1~~TRINITY_DN22727_c0_g1_i1.p1  ORF type:complete len:213 (+),score=27.34 TRINITY_DN22727_c0_g1_i1:74-712(+)
MTTMRPFRFDNVENDALRMRANMQLGRKTEQAQTCAMSGKASSGSLHGTLDRQRCFQQGAKHALGRSRSSSLSTSGSLAGALSISTPSSRSSSSSASPRSLSSTRLKMPLEELLNPSLAVNASPSGPLRKLSLTEPSMSFPMPSLHDPRKAKSSPTSSNLHRYRSQSIVSLVGDDAELRRETGRRNIGRELWGVHIIPARRSKQACDLSKIM